MPPNNYMCHDFLHAMLLLVGVEGPSPCVHVALLYFWQRCMVVQQLRKKLEIIPRPYLPLTIPLLLLLI